MVALSWPFWILWTILCKELEGVTLLCLPLCTWWHPLWCFLMQFLITYPQKKTYGFLCCHLRSLEREIWLNIRIRRETPWELCPYVSTQLSQLLSDYALSRLTVTPQPLPCHEPLPRTASKIVNWLHKSPQAIMVCFILVDTLPRNLSKSHPFLDFSTASTLNCGVLKVGFHKRKVHSWWYE